MQLAPPPERVREVSIKVEVGDRFRLSLMPSTLHRGRFNGDDIPRTTESILSFDDDYNEFSRKLQQLSKEWEGPPGVWDEPHYS